MRIKNKWGQTPFIMQDFLYAILDLFDTHYGHQIQRFFEDHSEANLKNPKPPQSTEDPPF